MIENIILQAQAAALLAHEQAEAFGETDPHGVAMTLITMGIVLAALILLYVTFKYVAKLYGMEFKRRAVEPQQLDIQSEGEISGEVNAAIALALHLYRTQLHDNEDPVITMKRVARTYSPWSSKIYGLTKNPK
jgi:Na+-transporting methylmalonyl-CoA/oxaloacetate decarboxylase gamma subunit